jgi:hypothetical protein
VIDQQKKLSAIQDDKIKGWFESLESKKIVSAYLMSRRDSTRNLLGRDGKITKVGVN